MLAAVVAAAAGHAAAIQPPADDGPVVVGERNDSWRFFELKSYAAALDFNTRYRSDTLRQAGQPDVVDRELRQRETLDLSGEAYFGHKNLVDLTASAQLGWEDIFLDSDLQPNSDHESQLVDLYNINALVLGNSFMPTSIYTRRDQVLLNQAFSSSIDSITNETGFITNIRSSVAPTQIHAFHLENNQNDQLGLNDSSITQDSFSAQSNITVTDQNRLDVNYTFDHINESRGSTFKNDYDRHDALLSDTWKLSDKTQDQLRSFLRFYDESGLFPYQTIRWDEQLQLYHTDHLESRYNTSAEHLTRDGLEQTLARGDATIRHKLFDSLVSSGTVGGQYLTSSENFDSSDVFATGTLEYTKQIPYGRIDSSVGAGINYQMNSDRGGTLAVVNESHTFNDPFPITLSRRQIVPGTVVVTAVGGFPTYQENVDYTVQYFADRAEIRVVIGRGIVDGQTVLVDYDIGPEPGSNIDTVSTSVSFRYTFTETFLQGLGFYTSYRTSDNHVDAVNPSAIVVDNTRVLIYGSEYKRAGITLRAEQELRESTTNPYDTTRFLASYDLLLSPGSVVGADLSYDLVDYKTPVNHVAFGQASARWDQRIFDGLNLDLLLRYRTEQDDLAGDSQGFEQSLGVRWKYRQTNVYLNLHNSMLYGETSDTLSQALEFGLRRDF